MHAHPLHSFPVPFYCIARAYVLGMLGSPCTVCKVERTKEQRIQQCRYPLKQQRCSLSGSSENRASEGCRATCIDCGQLLLFFGIVERAVLISRNEGTSPRSYFILVLLLGLAPSFLLCRWQLVKSESRAPLSQRKITTARSLLLVG